ncbi:Ig-like domain repeat protein [Nocardioides sp. R-C-SC26]|uniref:Ig-like domain repeat protein n=1 Tax=Nocardioides sp. R-C-SC26 TaxID=2870414 RepID=UPI001E58F9AB|nr:Ig-like domain repeat protein [Nocardioides sp. R-C-SC26]
MLSPQRAVGAVAITSALALGTAVAAPASLAADPQPRATHAAQSDLLGGLLNLEVITAPLLGGSPQVGNVLTAVAPVWNLLTGVTTSVTWLRDGVAIPGATGLSYLSTAQDVGRTITAQFTGNALGGLLGTVLSLVVPTNGVVVTQGASPVATKPTAISGVPQLGSTLSAIAPVWNVLNVLTSFQWLRDGVPIAGATGLTYSLTSNDLGRQISVVATGLLDGLDPTRSVSSFVTALLGGRPEMVEAPKVVGGASVGSLLTADPGEWTQKIEFVFQWLRDGVPITGATASTYTTTAADAGREVAVKVVPDITGYDGAAATTGAHLVDKLASLTALKPASRQVTRGTTAVVKLAVYAASGAPSGELALLDGSTVVQRFPLPGGSELQVVTARLSKLGVGTHRLRAVYLGDDRTAATASNVAVLKVVKAKKGKKSGR